MRIDKLEIENFKLFAQQEFTFHPQFNLVIGENGSGKTSLLRALSVALGGWAHTFIANDSTLRPIGDDEVREIQREGRFDKTKRTSIKAKGKANIIGNYKQEDIDAEWTRWRVEGDTATFLNGQYQIDSPLSHRTQYYFNFQQLISNVLNSIEKGERVSLPLIAVYECDRLWLPTGEFSSETAAKARYSRFDAYLDCFHSATDHQAVGEWLLKQKLISLDEGEETVISKSMRKAAQAALENCVGFKFDITQARVMVEFVDGTITPFEHLSDGQRTIVSLFCDIARRATILNPHWAGSASSFIKGVVLIDELDLHLHPKWQRNIIENLRKAFPNIQFICTTHSPFLIQSLRSGEELIMLDGQPTAQLANKSIEEIAQGIMGIANPQVAARYEEMKGVAKSYLETLEEAALAPEEKLAAFKERLASSLAPYADNPAFQAVLEMEKVAKLGE